MKNSVIFAGVGLVALVWAAAPVPAQEEEVLPELLHDALAGALAGNPDRVSSILEVLEEDQQEDPEAWSGVLDDIAVLEILSASIAQKEKARRLKKRTSEINDLVARERLSALAERVEEYRLEELIKKRRLNRVTGVVNSVWRTVSRVMAGQPRAVAGTAVDWGLTLAGRKGPTPVDKELAYLARVREIRGEASPREIERGRALIRSVEKKRSRRLARRWKARIEDRIEADNLRGAYRLSRLGADLWPEDPWFEKRIDELQKKLASRSGSVPETPPGTPPVSTEEEARARILRKKLAEQIEWEPFVSDEPARERIGAAYAERRSRTLDYLLFGDTSSGLVNKTMLKTVAEQGSDAPATLAFFQGAGTVIRGISLLFGNDLGLERTIDTYAYLERETPGVLTEKDRKKWADLCAKQGDYREALNVLKRGGIENPKREKKYRAAWAADIVKRCRDLPPGTDRFRALTFVIEEMGETRAAKKARRLLEETPSTERPLVRVETRDLLAHERLLEEAGFQFRKDWWDRDPQNGEVAEGEVYWDPAGVLWYRVEKGSPWRKVRQPEDRLPRIQAAFSKIEESILARVLFEKRRGKRKFPIEIEGEVGGSTYISPKLVQFDLTGDNPSLFE